MPRHAVAAHDRVAHQRVARIHACHQHSRHSRIFQQHTVYGISHCHRHDETQQTEHNRLVPVLLEVVHVHLHAREKHDVQESDVAEKLETAVADNDVEPVFADDHTRENHADYVRDAQLAEYYRRKKDYAQHDEENPCRVLNWEISCYVANQFSHN